MFIYSVVEHMRRECWPSSMLPFETMADAVDLVKKYYASTYASGFHLQKGADIRIGMNPGFTRNAN